jgi:hypothetical protein
VLGVRKEKGDRPDSNRCRGVHDPECLPLHHGHHEAATWNGDDRIRTGDDSVDNRALWPC